MMSPPIFSRLYWLSMSAVSCARAVTALTTPQAVWSFEEDGVQVGIESHEISR
jgi:hypothetical protein